MTNIISEMENSANEMNRLDIKGERGQLKPEDNNSNYLKKSSKRKNNLEKNTSVSHETLLFSLHKINKFQKEMRIQKKYFKKQQTKIYQV